METRCRHIMQTYMYRPKQKTISKTFRKFPFHFHVLLHLEISRKFCNIQLKCLFTVHNKNRHIWDSNPGPLVYKQYPLMQSYMLHMCVSRTGTVLFFDNVRPLHTFLKRFSESFCILITIVKNTTTPPPSLEMSTAHVHVLLNRI